MLTEQIQRDLVTAMKNRDVRAVGALRLLKSSIQNMRIDQKKELSDDEVVTVIRKHIKQLAQANVDFEKGKRSDLVEENKAHIDILSAYLPPEMSEDELRTHISSLVEENAALISSKPQALIGMAIKRFGQSASPERIISIVKEKISAL